MTQGQFGSSEIWKMIEEELGKHGIDLELPAGDDADPARVKVVCLCGDLRDTVRELGANARDQVVMVRIDEGTKDALDAWVETGAVKSRSEAAALFIAEGLQVRSKEHEQLQDALRDVEEAKSRLREKARDVLGEQNS